MKRLAALAAGALALLFRAGPASPPAVVDSFEDVSRWRAAPSSGVSLALSRADGAHGAGMRLDFDFQGHAGWAAVRREIPTELPDNWEISFAVRGSAAANDLEFKLVDASGENVWWSVRRDWTPPGAWTNVRLKKRRFSFAWGPAADHELKRFAAIEIAVTARAGGRGWIALDDLTLTPLPPASPPPAPVLTASASDEGFGPARAMDGDTVSAWRTAASPAWLSIDLGERREYGGLTVRWEPGRSARRYAVETSDDGSTWSLARNVQEGGVERADLYLPESESRFVRLRLLQPQGNGSKGFGIREMVVQPLAYSESPNAFLEAVARESPHGAYPRSFVGEQEYWTVAGVSGDSDCALLSEDGAVEPSRGAFSVAPFLFAKGRLYSWSDVRTEHSLERGDLPVPRVRWKGMPGVPGASGAPGFPLNLEITALASGAPGASVVEARYRVTNPGKRRLSARLFLAVRPFQVNPPQQFLNGRGGASPIHSLAWDGRAVAVDGTARIFPSGGRAPAGFGALAFESGSLAEVLAAGKLPPSSSARDGLGFASGALAWDLDLAGGASEDVIVALPIHGGAPHPAAGDGGFERRLAVARETWGGEVDRVGLFGPPEAEDLLRSVRTNLADILVERDGPALRPGTRAYARSWIRDGAMMSAALLRLGHESEARSYIAWFAKFQEPEGRVPCCVDRRGADPVVENDSHGELIFAIAEYFRFTKDRPFLESMFPHVQGAVSWIDRERQRRRTDAYRAPAKLAFFGLLPESISHEGYSAKPVHSYWDDFWALKGLADATDLAAALGRENLRARWAAIRDEFAADLHASIARVSREHGLDTLPASADLADFDPTSTTIALDPAGDESGLPGPALRRTFEKYFAEFRAREKSADWDAYTPYELRSVGAFVRLGWRDRAHELLRFFLAGRRPPEWNAWAEVVGREPRTPRFVGDIPHAWVGSDFIRSVLDLYAWERASDGALVIASGIPASWLEGSRPVGVANLRTPHGRLTWSMRRESAGRVAITVAGGLDVPRGGIALRPPLAAGVWRATVNGKEAAFSGEEGEELVVRAVPARVVFVRAVSGKP